MYVFKNNNNNKVGNLFNLWGMSTNTLCASAAGSASELAGFSVDVAPVARPTSFFPRRFRGAGAVRRPVLLRRCLSLLRPRRIWELREGARGFTAGTGATPPAAEVIHGGMKRPRTMPGEAKAPRARVGGGGGGGGGAAAVGRG